MKDSDRYHFTQQLIKEFLPWDDMFMLVIAVIKKKSKSRILEIFQLEKSRIVKIVQFSVTAMDSLNMLLLGQKLIQRIILC